MSDDCVFCKIARKEVATQPIYEDHDLIAFADIQRSRPSTCSSFRRSTCRT
jgi:histidine triad (HIT) family protein